MALITLDEAKEYLRVDSADEDVLICALISSAGQLARDVARLTDEKWSRLDAGEGDAHIREILKIAILYAVGYLYEHREEADHHGLTLTLRSLLFSIREGVV